MRISKARLYAAGLVAFLLGMPLTEEAYAQSWAGLVGWVVEESIYASAGGS